MAFPDIRGDGLIRAQMALEALQRDPQLLDYTRRRFSDSPPSYKSHQSHNSTLSQSPIPPGEDQGIREENQRREEQRFRLIKEHGASSPYEQFTAQWKAEVNRITDAAMNRTEHVPIGISFYSLAQESVKKRWIEQGIWNDKWNGRTTLASTKWKHEEPEESDSESDTDRPVTPQSRFSFFPTEPKPRRQKSDQEKQLIAERRAALKREREASRPFHQFVYQVLKESELIQGKTGGEGVTAPATTADDINTQAYENIKSTWVRRGIWDIKWGILPGMNWKHERPLEIGADLLPLPQVNSLGNDSHDAGEAPLPRLFDPIPPDETDARQTSGVVSTPQRGHSADNSVRFANGDAEDSSESNPPSGRQRGEDVFPVTGQMERSGGQRFSSEDRQPPLNKSFLGPVHSSRVSKSPPERRRGRQQPPNPSAEVTSGGPSLPGPDVTRTPSKPASTPLRRSKRLQQQQPPEPRETEIPGETASTKSPKAVSKRRPKQATAANSKSVLSARSQGISKNRRTSARRGKKQDDR
ncbi:hypothetical protein HCBG_01019 [Histoplasma capsulatum G186AR]|uniref:Uncharacterized protein n=2 Tax=Ajellomyces capsulatus TaxID=5037 RepID=C0ND23_AJECG|nr:uncharacterized protein HCBG_01019 [Histoplasma capsulatum G186AR]EEH11564.1 hypothetical protein HCBG_01019 [Histoplasma capsulatum G186AR]KAG5302596.1 hypothetical protein I7I52_00287 [Histoplasma capsulatum]QSS72004.1 hypothetical protein I7I50_03047 [Histoplasma capsulatum G186AR]